MIELRVGVPGFTTVKATVLVFPPVVPRNTFRVVRAAVAEMVTVAVTVSGAPPVPAV